MQNKKKYYLNVSSYKYKREYMKLYQPNIDKILNTYSNNNQDIIIQSQNLCPGGKRCKNYLIIINLEQKIKELNDKVNQLTKIKEYSESNHNIDFTPMKKFDNNKKDTFNEICNSFRNSGIKKKLNSSTRNQFGNLTLQPQISEPYRLRLDYKNNNENRVAENKKLNGKKVVSLDINKFKNIAVRLNSEKLGGDEKYLSNKSEENNDIKNNKQTYDEKEKKIQNLLNHIFNNKTNELVITRKSENEKNKEINVKKGGTKFMKRINIPKIKVKPYNLLIPNKINKTKNNKRYNSEIDDKKDKIESKDENLLYFRKFKGEVRNSYNSTKNKFLSKSLGFSNDSNEEKNSLFNNNDSCSKTVSEDKKQSLYKLNGFRPLTHNQKPFTLKLNISQNNEFNKEEKSKTERNENYFGNIEAKILSPRELDHFQFEDFLNILDDKNIEKYKLLEEICKLLSNENYEEIIDYLKSLTKEKIEDYINFIKYSFKYIKILLEIFNKLKKFYNISNPNENNINNSSKDIKCIKEQLIKYKTNIQQILPCDSIHIYIYDPNSDFLILKGENEDLKFSKDKDLIGSCFKSGKPFIYKMKENSSFIEEQKYLKQRAVNKDDNILFYPIKDIDNNIYGVIEVINKNTGILNPEEKNIFDKKNEIILFFISKILGTFLIYYN